MQSTAITTASACAAIQRMRLATEDFKRSVSLVSLGPAVPEGKLVHFYLDGVPWATSGTEEECALMVRLSPAAKRSWVLSRIAARHAWPRSTGAQHVPRT